MSTNLTQLVEAFAELNVVVIGEAMLDSYLKGSARGLCPEAPVPVVTLSSRHDLPGGAANTAANIRSLGGHVALLSVVGDDPESALLRQALEAQGVSTEHLLAQPSRRTLAKHRIMAESQILVRYDQGSADPIDRSIERALIERLSDLFLCADVVIISDYGYGILTPRVIAALAALQKRSPGMLAVDSKHLAAYRQVGATLAKPNYGQALQLLGARSFEGQSERVEQIVSAGARLLDLTGAQIAAVTLDVDGALVFERGSPPYRTYARPTSAARPAGAGDTFLSVLALALAAGAETPTAAELASAAAAIVTGKEATGTCTAHELRSYVSTDDKIVGHARQLGQQLEVYRQRGLRVVLTNGCFDILHRGHVTYLSRAKALGDVLIVGVNADATVRRLKGPDRPINTLEDRAQVLAALSCVDHVVVFEEETPVQLVRAIRPDVFVKGGDYTRERLPEAAVVEELGGIVQILPYIDDHSTSSIIERIHATSAQHLASYALGR